MRAVDEGDGVHGSEEEDDAEVDLADDAFLILRGEGEGGFAIAGRGGGGLGGGGGGGFFEVEDYCDVLIGVFLRFVVEGRMFLFFFFLCFFFFFLTLGHHLIFLGLGHDS